jgi:hypothetical protein
LEPRKRLRIHCDRWINGSPSQNNVAKPFEKFLTILGTLPFRRSFETFANTGGIVFTGFTTVAPTLRAAAPCAIWITPSG